MPRKRKQCKKFTNKIQIKKRLINLEKQFHGISEKIEKLQVIRRKIVDKVEEIAFNLEQRKNETITGKDENMITPDYQSFDKNTT